MKTRLAALEATRYPALGSWNLLALSLFCRKEILYQGLREPNLIRRFSDEIQSSSRFATLITGSQFAGSSSDLCKWLKIHGDVSGVQIPADLHDFESEVEHVSVAEGAAFEHLDHVVVALGEG